MSDAPGGMAGGIAHCDRFSDRFSDREPGHCGAWQSFAREEFDGVDSDPLALFDETLRELAGLFPGT